MEVLTQRQHLIGVTGSVRDGPDADALGDEVREVHAAGPTIRNSVTDAANAPRLQAGGRYRAQVELQWRYASALQPHLLQEDAPSTPSVPDPASRLC